ncbi:hypothetical protein SB749_19490, partial [Brevibacterium sp. SIMBA_078]
MDNEQKLLQLSAKLYQFLEHVPKGEKRDGFLQEVDRQLDERGKLLDVLGQAGIQLNAQNKVHRMLLDLD